MKVCTDSCILGAYVPIKEAQNILDIGTGTGLLALMAAQRSNAQITALEINEAAANQARENIAASPWADRTTLKPISLQAFEKHNQEVYDVIVCNPPFYADSHKSADEARNIAMHSSELTFADIIRFSLKFLQLEGKLWMLLPPAESALFTDQAQEAGLFCHSSLTVFTSPAGKHIRTIQSFSKLNCPQPNQEELIIRNPDHSYTSAFQNLLKDYYLIF